MRGPDPNRGGNFLCGKLTDRDPVGRPTGRMQCLATPVARYLQWGGGCGDWHDDDDDVRFDARISEDVTLGDGQLQPEQTDHVGHSDDVQSSSTSRLTDQCPGNQQANLTSCNNKKLSCRIRTRSALLRVA